MKRKHICPVVSRTSRATRIKKNHVMHDNVMQGFTFFISCVCIERAVAEEAYLFKALKDFPAPS